MGLVQRVLGRWGVKDEVVRVLAREKDGRPSQHSGRRLVRRRLDPALQVTVSCVAVKRHSKRAGLSQHRERGRGGENGSWSLMGKARQRVLEMDVGNSHTTL